MDQWAMSPGVPMGTHLTKKGRVVDWEEIEQIIFGFGMFQEEYKFETSDKP